MVVTRIRVIRSRIRATPLASAPLFSTGVGDGFFALLPVRLVEGSDFQQLEAKGPESIYSAVQGGLVDLLGPQRGVTCFHDDVEVFKSGDDGWDRLARKFDLISSQGHLAIFTGQGADCILLSMRADRAASSPSRG